jgi:hypothetical protein
MTGFIVIGLVVSTFAGSWTGTMTAVTTNDSAFMVLAQDGNTITGTIGPDAQAQFKITRASVDGDTLTIEAQPGGTLRFVLKMDGEKLAGEVFEDGQMIGTIRFARAKQQIM